MTIIMMNRRWCKKNRRWCKKKAIGAISIDAFQHRRRSLSWFVAAAKKIFSEGDVSRSTKKVGVELFEAKIPAVETAIRYTREHGQTVYRDGQMATIGGGHCRYEKKTPELAPVSRRHGPGSAASVGVFHCHVVWHCSNNADYFSLFPI